MLFLWSGVLTCFGDLHGDYLLRFDDFFFQFLVNSKEKKSSNRRSNPQEGLRSMQEPLHKRPKTLTLKCRLQRNYILFRYSSPKATPDQYQSARKVLHCLFLFHDPPLLPQFWQSLGSFHAKKAHKHTLYKKTRQSNDSQKKAQPALLLTAEKNKTVSAAVK